jgi:hypothetical protein
MFPKHRAPEFSGRCFAIIHLTIGIAVNEVELREFNLGLRNKGF